MKNWQKALFGLGITFIVVLISVIFFSYNIIKNTLPTYDGEIECKDVLSKVEIYRDSLAIPYIKAPKDLDAYFALGYVHAQERLFQMDLMRRAGSGRLSEIFGKKTIPYDKMFKTLGLQRVVNDNFTQIDKQTLQVLSAYSNGVNYFIHQNKDNLPLEFAVLDYRPYDWKPTHSLLIAKMLAWELNISWWTDFSFTHLVQKFGYDKIKDILPNFEQNKEYLISKQIKSLEAINSGLVETDKKFREFVGFEGTHIGSNNWVVNGTHSASGKPIIANDPHLAFQAPGRWFIAVIKADNRTTAGLTLPGVPGVVIGKNDKISWTVTNVMADDADFYIEQLDSSKSNYLLDGNWKKLNIIKDTVYVKDGNTEILEIKQTHRGPIISDIHPFNVIYPNKYRKNPVLSMRWTALDYSNELLSFLAINKSKNFGEFKEAVKYFHTPGQNFVYADIDGNIGYICGAKLPIRKTSSPTLIFDGTTSNSDWSGFVPYEQMPKIYNPANGFIATANNKVVESFPYHISNLWEPNSRILRITGLLKSKDKHSVKDFQIYQNDYYSEYASELVPFVISAFNNAEIKEKNLVLALKLLKKWDFNMDADSQVPTIYANFLQHLIKNIFADEMGKTYLQEYSFIANIPYRVVLQLLYQNSSIWFDNVKTQKYENRDDIVRKSLIDALSELEDKLGNELYLWQWGTIHKVTFKHSFSGFSSFTDKFVNIGPFEIGGDGTTINNGEYSFNKPFANNLGPSMRYIYDFADPDNFYCILPTGQSGHIFSLNYKNMTKNWLSGKYIKVNTNFDNIESSFLNKLLFTSKNQE
ncbi:MAG: penicillin acylase family protein [bacterium]